MFMRSSHLGCGIVVFHFIKLFSFFQMRTQLAQILDKDWTFPETSKMFISRGPKNKYYQISQITKIWLYWWRFLRRIRVNMNTCARMKRNVKNRSFLEGCIGTSRSGSLSSFAILTPFLNFCVRYWKKNIIQFQLFPFNKTDLWE